MLWLFSPLGLTVILRVRNLSHDPKTIAIFRTNSTKAKLRDPNSPSKQSFTCMICEQRKKALSQFLACNSRLRTCFEIFILTTVVFVSQAEAEGCNYTSQNKNFETITKVYHMRRDRLGNERANLRTTYHVTLNN